MTDQSWQSPGIFDVLSHATDYGLCLVYPPDAQVLEFGNVPPGANQFNTRGSAVPQVEYTIERVAGFITAFPDPSWWVAQAFWTLDMRLMVLPYDTETLQPITPANWQMGSYNYAHEPFMAYKRHIFEFNSEKTFGIENLEFDWRVKRRCAPDTTLYLMIRFSGSTGGSALEIQQRIRTLVSWHGQRL